MEFFDIRGLPREMIKEVVKRVDLKGKLALRKVCRFTKRIVDEEAWKATKIDRITFMDDLREAKMLVTLDNSISPLFLLQYTKQWQFKRWTNGTIQQFNINMPRDDFLEFLIHFRTVVGQCRIDSLQFLSREECHIALFESFVKGLTIEDRCLNMNSYYGEYRKTAFDTIRRLNMNGAYMGVHAFSDSEEKLRMAETVDSLILYKDHFEQIKEPVSLAIAVLSRRCSRLELEASWLNEEQMKEMIEQLQKLDKKLYFYSRLDKGFESRQYKVGEMNVNVKMSQYCGELEIWHDGMRRRNLD